jgi:hypothetical protein
MGKGADHKSLENNPCMWYRGLRKSPALTARTSSCEGSAPLAWLKSPIAGGCRAQRICRLSCT